jgi:hypothetical protein
LKQRTHTTSDTIHLFGIPERTLQRWNAFASQNGRKRRSILLAREFSMLRLKLMTWSSWRAWLVIRKKHEENKMAGLLLKRRRLCLPAFKTWTVRLNRSIQRGIAFNVLESLGKQWKMQCSFGSWSGIVKKKKTLRLCGIEIARLQSLNTLNRLFMRWNQISSMRMKAENMVLHKSQMQLRHSFLMWKDQWTRIRDAKVLLSRVEAGESRRSFIRWKKFARWKAAAHCIDRQRSNRIHRIIQKQLFVLWRKKYAERCKQRMLEKWADEKFEKTTMKKSFFQWRHWIQKKSKCQRILRRKHQIV